METNFWTTNPRTPPAHAHVGLYDTIPQCVWGVVGWGGKGGSQTASGYPGIPTRYGYIMLLQPIEVKGIRRKSRRVRSSTYSQESLVLGSESGCRIRIIFPNPDPQWLQVFTNSDSDPTEPCQPANKTKLNNFSWGHGKTLKGQSHEVFDSCK